MIAWLNSAFITAHGIDVSIRQIAPYPSDRWDDRRYCATLTNDGRKITVYITCGCLAPEPDPALALDLVAFVACQWDDAADSARWHGDSHYRAWCAVWDKDDTRVAKRAYRCERRWVARLKVWCGSIDFYNRLTELAQEDPSYDTPDEELLEYYCEKIGA